MQESVLGNGAAQEERRRDTRRLWRGSSAEGGFVAPPQVRRSGRAPESVGELEQFGLGTRRERGQYIDCQASAMIDVKTV